tara:strand:- start:542 stop:1216 length:675 start_codon:yes stop_codon:yes gene_type:complete
VSSSKNKDDILTLIPDAFLTLIKKLEEKEIQISTMKSIEMFSRAGNLHTKHYADKVSSLEAWEIDPQWENELKKNLPNAKIIIGDSINYVLNSKNEFTYDLIVIDSPLNNYGDKDGMFNVGPFCEHFDFIKHVNNIIDKKAIVIFNVNIKPFNYKKWPLLKKRRDEFYGENVDTSNLKIDFLLDFYTKLFIDEGLKTHFHIHVPRATYDDVERLYYFAYSLEKI